MPSAAQEPPPDIANEYRITGYPSYPVTEKLSGFGYLGYVSKPDADYTSVYLGAGSFYRPVNPVQLWIGLIAADTDQDAPGKSNQLELRPFVGAKFMGANATKWRSSSTTSSRRAPCSGSGSGSEAQAQQSALNVATARNRSLEKESPMGATTKRKPVTFSKGQGRAGAGPADVAGPLGSRAEQHAAGKALRDTCPRTAHATWKPPSDRQDAVGLVLAAEKGRMTELLPLRHGRMVKFAFTFYRGAALTMAADLAVTPSTGIRVQCRGDGHLCNFGGFATPERKIIFSINDLDETLPAPWEWDLKRLAASFVVACRDNSLREAVA